MLGNWQRERSTLSSGGVRFFLGTWLFLVAMVLRGANGGGVNGSRDQHSSGGAGLNEARHDMKPNSSLHEI